MIHKLFVNIAWIYCFIFLFGIYIGAFAYLGDMIEKKLGMNWAIFIMIGMVLPLSVAVLMTMFGV